ncbi:MAG: polymer-forming cytoskeletal protein [bacterium]|nr:polymer-forming cytoskeletal protein [bacterium]
MALFGKKETEGKSAGVQPPPVKKDMPMEQKKTAPKNPPSAAAKDTSKDTTYLGKNLKINGNVSGEGNLIILGVFDGDFELKGQLKVAQGAVIKGNIKATGVSINGKVDGTIEASERILLDTTASMKGRLVTPKISIQDGAVFDGELQMSKKTDQVPKTATSEVKQPSRAPAVSEIK